MPLKNAGVSANLSNIYRWFIRYSAMLHAYMQTLPIKAGEMFSADEMFVSIRGKERYLFMINDVETCFCLAHEMACHKDGHNAAGLLQAAKKKAGKTPCEIVTDALRSYEEAFAKALAPNNSGDKSSFHISSVSLGNKKRNNNIQERFNGTVRGFLKPRRGIKRGDTSLVKRFVVFYNLLRTHTSLERAPAEAAGITITGKHDKWGNPDRKRPPVCQDDGR